MFACVIGAPVGGINAVISSEEYSISLAHGFLYLCKPAVYLSQGLRVPLTISTMAPQHIEFYQIHKEQTCKVSFKPVQRDCHPVAVRFCMVALGQTASCKKVFNLADADAIFAVFLE